MDRSGQWDIFCKVIDNFGDIGVCWRLAADLAGRGHRVRLWADDVSALAWMAPGGCDGVSVSVWDEHSDWKGALEGAATDVLVEAFGCDVPEAFLVEVVRPPVWINLEYLSAERYAARNHGLPSRVQHGPAAGWTKWFFYPGFTGTTGGLLREPGLAAQMADFDRQTWLAGRGITWRGERLISLFCYEPAALPSLLHALQSDGLGGEPARLLVTAGRASAAVRQALGAVPPGGKLSVDFLPAMPQSGFDRLLWSCDLNLVRGEDSLVRAIWAGKPFVWQLYPQEDGAHHLKLQAFMDAMGFGSAERRLHLAWNADTAPAAADNDLSPLADPPQWQAWQGASRTASARLAAEADLVTRLLGFVAKNR